MARAEIGAEARQLPLERRQRGGDQRLLETKAEFGQQIARREIVAAIGDEIVRGDNLLGILGAKAHGMGFDADAIIDGVEGGPRAVDLERPDPFGGMHDLALQIGQIDPVVVDDADRPDTGGGEIEQHRRAEPAGADDEHARLQQLFLSLFADLFEDQVAGISLKLLFAEFHGCAVLVARRSNVVPSDAGGNAMNHRPVDPKPPAWRLPDREKSVTMLNCGRATRVKTSWAMRSPGWIRMPSSGSSDRGLRFHAEMKQVPS